MTEFKTPENFSPTLPPRSKLQALKEGLINAPFYAATWPLMAYDLGESAVDALRGTQSPNRMTQAASALKRAFGGEHIPQESERGVEDWDTAKYELAGSLPAFSVDPLRALRNIPNAIKHGAQQFALAQNPARVVKQKGGNWPEGALDRPLARIKRSHYGYKGPEGFVPIAEDELVPAGSMLHQPTGEILTHAEFAPLPRLGAINSWIEGPLAKYIRNDLATSQDPIRQALEAFPAKKEAALTQLRKQREAAIAKRDAAMQQRGVPEHYMTQANEDIRNLEQRAAEWNARKGLHFTPEELLLSNSFGKALNNRFISGGSPTGVFRGPLPEGRTPNQDSLNWDDLADSVLRIRKTGKIEKVVPKFAEGGSVHFDWPFRRA